MGQKGMESSPIFFPRKIMSEKHLEYGMALFVHSVSQNVGSSIFLLEMMLIFAVSKKNIVFLSLGAPHDSPGG